MLLERVRALSSSSRDRDAARHTGRWGRFIRSRFIAPGPWAVALAVMLVGTYFIDRGIQWNTDTHLYLTVSIVDRGTLNIDPFATFTGDIAAAHGHYYADKAPGLSLLAVPLYLVIKLLVLHGQSFAVAPDPFRGADQWVRYLIAVALAAVPTGLIAALLYKLLERMGGGRWWCAGLALTYGLGTIARPFASVFFSHQVAALLCFAAFFVLFLVRRQERDDRFALVAGFLVGYALITEFPTAIVAAALGVYAVTVARRGRRLAALLGLGTLPPLALGALYNTLAFGSPLGMGYGHLAGPQYYREGQSQGLFGVTVPHFDAVWGTTFSPYRGLFFLSPVLLLAIPGCVLLARRAGWRAEALVCAVVGGAYQLFNWSYFAWNGGASTGPRQLLPSIPFLVLPIGALVVQGVAWGDVRRWRVATAALAAYSIAFVELCAAVNPLLDQHFISPITQYVLPRLAGLGVQIAHPWKAQAQLWPALLHSAPLFRTAKLEYNWGQVADWPGLVQLYPLVVIVALILLWSTLRARLAPPLSKYLARTVARLVA